MSGEPHPFAKFVAILGRGKTKQRHLTLEESREAMGMILRDEARPEQIGAFLMLLRLKEEAPEEIAGFALGGHDTMQIPADLPQVWRGQIGNGYATASVVGTIAVTLRTMGKAASIKQAEAMARDLWAARDMGFVAG